MTTSAYSAVFSIQTTVGNTVLNGSGTLLTGGKYVLTAAHVVEGAANASQVRVSSTETSLPNVAAIYQYPGWDSNDSSFNHDIAIIELATPVTSIQGLEIYRSDSYVGQEFTRVGHSQGSDNLHVGTNIYDTDGSSLNTPYSRNIEAGTQMLYDYDNGLSAQNALGNISNSSETPTENETIAVPGDSGGPALINSQVAGIASYVAALGSFDVNDSADFSHGEVGADTKVSSYQAWIDFITQGNIVYEAPSKAVDVQKTVMEPDFGTVTNYFLLSMQEPRDEKVRLWYETSDGTATAGKDYQAASGWIDILVGETSAAIPVQILGDQLSEGTESFYMNIKDNSGYYFDSSIILTAVHYIADNDGTLIG